MDTTKQFSIRARAKSFVYAFEGVISFFRSEHNALLHLLATVLVISLSIIFPVSRFEAIALIIVTGLVWMAELFNTAIEKMSDFISTKKNHKIKFIKDISAAAVLVTAFMAVAVGCFVFIPKL
jgi:diacylglycerol kinase (ATP)